MRIKSIPTINHYIKSVFSVSKPDKTLFRGQGRNWSLAPKLARKEFQFGSILDKESRMFNEFKRRAPLLLNGSQVQGEIDWEWLALAQHHWMATRLLDWSLNPLIALFFAVENPYQPLPEEPESEQHGVVWILEYSDRQSVSPVPETSPFVIKSTKIYFPRCVTSRIVNQAGCFTVHYLNEEQGCFVPLEEDPEYSSKLTKLIIPAASFPKIRKQLEIIGIHPANIYPDVDGLAKHLTRMESLLPDEQREVVSNVRKNVVENLRGISMIR
ncbi:FRG domain-containing protein [Geothrix sp. 21YS21S-2]|uniref:FRG domain-containing protein n=1 Tax=Geothrix sp. 21YS21S-2 TaxID=3068893 RepID=UPI0027B95334|nr:FRG domain-containing protein [Geothrix sp. 21YS21S-2]